MRDQLRLLYLQLRYNALLLFVVLGLVSWSLEQVADELWETRGYRGLLSATIAPIGLVVLFRGALWLKERLWPPPQPTVGISPPPTRGLILLYGRQEVVQHAIDHHRERLEYIWFILTEETKAEFEQLPKHWWGKAIGTPEMIHNHYLPAETENAVGSALRHARVLGIDQTELTCDITGGTKAMTVGAFTAALLHDIAVQMTPARYDQTRKAQAPLPPIQIQIG